MIRKQRYLTDQTSEFLTPMELADLYGFERSRITWSCPLPNAAEAQDSAKS